MKLLKYSVFLIVLLTALISANTVTRYVSPTGSNTAPYTSWETAARDIQTAVNLCSEGDLILVGNGTYVIKSNILVTKGITIRSLNGCANVIIDGNNVTRCIYINHPDAVIDGFTITKGLNPKGFGGGVNIVTGGTLQNCIITKCQARDGGGVAIDEGGLILNCTIKWNRADDSCSCSGYGGGVRMSRGGITRGCLIYGNTSIKMGGGVNIWDSGTIQNCTITKNTAPDGAGVKLRGRACMENTISYFNNGANWAADSCIYSLSNNCTTPALPAGTGHKTGDPLFINYGAENFFLSSASPCIDAGLNQSWMTSAKDLNGNIRISAAAVDIGAYEFIKTTPPPPPQDACIPTIIYPKDGMTIYPLTPLLCWYIGGSIDGYAFRVKYSTDSKNTNANGDLKIIDVGCALYITLPELECGKTYYWQVMSIKGGVYSEYSPIACFHTSTAGTVVVPEVPVPSWPVCGATVYLNSPYLSWYTLSGWSNIVSYTIRWGEKGNLNNVIEGIKCLSVQITGLLPGRQYQWTVEAVNRYGVHSRPCAVQEFFTSGGIGSKIYTPVQAWPVGGTIVYMTSPLVTWYFVQPIFGITEFKIRYSKNPDMSGAVELHQLGTIYTIQLNNLERGRTYYWQVQASDGHVCSEPQTPPASFTVYCDNFATIPLPLSPVGTVGLCSNSVELSWASIDNSSRPLTYNLQYSMSPDFESAIEIKNIGQNSFKVENLNNSNYYWRVQSKTDDGLVSDYSPVGQFFVQGVTSITEKKTGIDGFMLMQNYPNPFNPATSIQFNLPSESYITIEVFNSIGRSVGKIFEGNKPQGLSSLEFNAENLPSGIYFYKIIAVDLNGNTNYDIKKMMLLK